LVLEFQTGEELVDGLLLLFFFAQLPEVVKAAGLRGRGTLGPGFPLRPQVGLWERHLLQQLLRGRDV